MDAHTLDIPWSRRRLWWGFFSALGLVTFFAFAMLATPTRPGESASETLFFQTICLFSVIAIGIFLPVHARRLLRHAPAVVLSRDGILGGNGILEPRFLPWSEVADIQLRARHKDLKVLASPGYAGEGPSGGNVFWRLLDRCITRGDDADVPIPCLMLDIDVAALAGVVVDAHRWHTGSAADWQRFRSDVLDSDILSRTRPGLLAEAASHGKGLSAMHGCLTAIGMAVGASYIFVSLLRDWWLQIPDCADGGSPCELMTGGDMLTSLFSFGMPGGPTGRFLSLLNALGWVVLPGTVATLIILIIKALAPSA